MVFEPKKQHQKSPKPVIHLIITPEENTLILNECEVLDLTRSNFMRLCISEYFFKQEFEVGK